MSPGPFSAYTTAPSQVFVVIWACPLCPYSPQDLILEAFRGALVPPFTLLDTVPFRYGHPSTCQSSGNCVRSAACPDTHFASAASNYAHRALDVRRFSWHPHIVHVCACALLSRPVMLLNPSRPPAGYGPNASRPSALFGDLDDLDVSKGAAKLLGSNSIPPCLDRDLNLEEAAGNHDVGVLIRLVLPRVAGQQTRDSNEATETDTSSRKAPLATDRASVDLAAAAVEILRTTDLAASSFALHFPTSTVQWACPMCATSSRWQRQRSTGFNSERFTRPERGRLPSQQRGRTSQPKRTRRAHCAPCKTELEDGEPWVQRTRESEKPREISRYRQTLPWEVRTCDPPNARQSHCLRWSDHSTEDDYRLRVNCELVSFRGAERMDEAAGLLFSRKGLKFDVRKYTGRLEIQPRYFGALTAKGECRKTLHEGSTVNTLAWR